MIVYDVRIFCCGRLFVGVLRFFCDRLYLSFVEVKLSLD